MRLSKPRVLLLAFLIFFDTVVVIAAMLLAYEIRFFTFLKEYIPITKGIPSLILYKQLLLLGVPLFVFFFYQNNLYKAILVPFLDEVVRVGRSLIFGIIFLVLATYFYREYSFSRLVFVVFFAITVPTLVLYRQMIKVFTRYLLRKFVGRETVLIVGKNNRVIKNLLRKHPYVKTYFYPYDDDLSTQKLMGIINEKKIQQVILTHQNWSKKELLDFYDHCETNGISLKFVPDIIEICR